jgi:hypothetical protein
MVDNNSLLKLMSDSITREFPELTLIFYRSAALSEGYDLIVSGLLKPGIYAKSRVSTQALRLNPKQVYETVVFPMAQKVYAKEYSKLARLLRGEE